MQSLSWSVRDMKGLRQGCRAPEKDYYRGWEVYTRHRMICYSRATLDVKWIKDRGVITWLGNHAIIDPLTRQYSAPIYPEYRISDLGELSQAHGKLDAQFIHYNHSQRTSTSPQFQT